MRNIRHLDARQACALACSAAAFVVFPCVLFACGSQDEVGDGHWNGTAVDASFDGTFELADAYPTTDPDPDGGTRAAPSFGDGGTSTTTSADCTGKTIGSGDPFITLTSDNLLRDAYLHVPASYDKTKPTELVVNFHGFTSNAPEQIVLTRMNRAADSRNVIVAYPDGVGASWNAGDCCGDSWTNSVDDVQFTKDLLSKLENDYCIDPKKVFATGFSNGGFFSHRLGCGMSDVFGAIAPVSGVFGQDPTTCTPKRAMPVLDFHGTGDPIVPYNGGTPVIPIDLGSAFISFRSVPVTVDAWRQIDGCLGSGSVIYQNGDATCTEYSQCRSGSVVTHCKIDDGGHEWPGGVAVPFLGNTSNDISATDTILNFFDAHPLP
ncbi:MAG: extracellular catalytic domain type 1 short-chain-length polyhydroxyalkanoate depolymerase [Polyangiaceae bacterium]